MTTITTTTTTTKTKRRGRAASALAALAVFASTAGGMLAATAQPAAAEACTSKTAFSGDQYLYRMCGLPDIDQRRGDLANDGRMYCAPTAVLDALFWLEQHGYPNLLAGSYNPHDGTTRTFDALGSKLRVLGSQMDTSGIEGTTTTGLIAGFNEQIMRTGYYGQLSISWHSFDGELDPGRRLAELGAGSNGNNLVLPVVGWYDFPYSLKRAGGHVLAMTKAQGSGDQKYVTFHDPADSTELGTQSAPAERTFRVGVARFDRWDGGYAYKAKVIGYGSGWLDGAFVIRRGGSPTSSSSGTNWTNG